MIKHVAPQNQKSKHCRHCNQIIPLANFGKHVREMHPTSGMCRTFDIRKTTLLSVKKCHVADKKTEDPSVQDI